MTTKQKTKPFDVVEILHSEEDIQAYLTAVLESGASVKAIRKAFMDAERARAKLNQKEPDFGLVDIAFRAVADMQVKPQFMQVAI